ncbi:cytidine deaminase [Legionella impletisoli]|uniref:Cytidine deaminase n=1 Tax=Legionella impletisoli TaxID=343510 RepID=A0A917JNN0_9GAMM|nr:cytidine deaminase [Legionella impletisoli]GGI75279.1 cytidine deaminase [Legionella impletisoli]
MNDQIPLMIKKAREALKNAYSPYSNFQVACCLSSPEGDLFTGVNVENASYSLTTCAETSAIAQLIAAGKNSIQDLVLMNGVKTLCSPCGACRQRILEFASKGTTVHLCDHNRVLKTLTIDELLPLAFTFKPKSGSNHD